MINYFKPINRITSNIIKDYNIKILTHDFILKYDDYVIVFEFIKISL